jgi:hypothetical protein
MSPHQQTAIRVIALAFLIIIAGQVLQGIIGYLVAAAVAVLVFGRFFGRR